MNKIRKYIIEKENKIISKYGFEHKKTIKTFKYCELLRKLFYIYE